MEEQVLELETRLERSLVLPSREEDLALQSNALKVKD